MMHIAGPHLAAVLLLATACSDTQGSPTSPSQYYTSSSDGRDLSACEIVSGSNLIFRGVATGWGEMIEVPRPGGPPDALTPVQFTVSHSYRGANAATATVYVVGEISEHAGSTAGPIRTMAGPTDAFVFSAPYAGYPVLMGGGLVWRDRSTFRNNGVFSPGVSEAEVEAAINQFSGYSPPNCPEYQPPGGGQVDSGVSPDGGTEDAGS